jgi:hypothetical protein
MYCAPAGADSAMSRAKHSSVFFNQSPPFRLYSRGPIQLHTTAVIIIIAELPECTTADAPFSIATDHFDDIQVLYDMTDTGELV